MVRRKNWRRTTKPLIRATWPSRPPSVIGRNIIQRDLLRVECLFALTFQPFNASVSHHEPDFFEFCSKPPCLLGCKLDERWPHPGPFWIISVNRHCLLQRRDHGRP